MSNIIFGVDISKATFDVALLSDNKVKNKKFSRTFRTPMIKILIKLLK